MEKFKGGYAWIVEFGFSGVIRRKKRVNANANANVISLAYAGECLVSGNVTYPCIRRGAPGTGDSAYSIKLPRSAQFA